MNTLTILQLTLAALLVIDSFGRLVKVNRHTVAPVRHAFAGLFCAALWMAGGTAAELVPGAWPTVAMLLAILVLQLSTARYWRRGPPAAFQENPRCD